MWPRNATPASAARAPRAGRAKAAMERLGARGSASWRVTGSKSTISLNLHSFTPAHPRAAPARQRAGPLRHPARAVEGTSQQQLDLRVDAAEVVCRPPGECVVHRRVDAQEDLLAGARHE